MRIPPLLRLLRPALAPTAAADVIAGAAFAGAALPLRLLPAALGSMCVYAGGMALNDLVDRRRDAQLFPDRPLVANPSLLWPARLLCLALFGAGAALHAMAGVLLPGLLVGALAATYDLGAKRAFPLDALVLGAARAANLGVGFFLVGAAFDDGALTYLLAYGIYIAGVTGASRGEDLQDRGARRRAAILSVVFMLLAFGGLASLSAAPGRAFALLIPLGLIAFSLLRTLRDGTRAGIMRHVLACLLAIFLLHGTTLWMVARPVGAALVALCGAATLWLRWLLRPSAAAPVPGR